MDIPDKIRAASDEQSASSLDAARKFLHIYYADTVSVEETRRHLVSTAAMNPRTILEGLAGIEALLAQPPAPGTLSRLVAIDANENIDDPSDEGARIWLQEAAQLARDVIGR